MGERSADETQMPVGTPTIGVPGRRTPPSTWLTDALRALQAIDDEIGEDRLPEIGSAARQEAARVITALARHPGAPTVYPTQDGEIAIQFQSRDIPESVVILIDGHGRGKCYAYTGGRSQRAHYDAASDLPDGFVMEQLAALGRS